VGIFNPNWPLTGKMIRGKSTGHGRSTQHMKRKKKTPLVLERASKKTGIERGGKKKFLRPAREEGKKPTGERKKKKKKRKTIPLQKAPIQRKRSTRRKRFRGKPQIVQKKGGGKTLGPSKGPPLAQAKGGRPEKKGKADGGGGG